jgi:general stress protein 26
MNLQARESIVSLRKNSGTAYLASINGEGYPVMRAMLVLEHDGFGTQFFSTNTSSGKVRYYQNNPKASVYYCEPREYKGVLFIGKMQVCTDQETKDFLWREGFERYYPKGVTDPDYCVLKFTAKQGCFYNGPNSANFLIEELEEKQSHEPVIVQKPF